MNPSERIAQEIPLELAPRKDIEKIVAVLTSAFFSYPGIKFMTSIARDGKKAVRDYFYFWMEEAYINRAVFRASKKYEGVLVFCLVGYPKTNIWIRGKTLWANLNQFKISDIKKVYMHEGDLDRAHHRVMGDRPHYYLELLGVDPKFQGKKIASRLVNPVLAYADRVGNPCYLETSSAQNTKVYGGWGFKVVETIPTPFIKNKTVYLMVRKPASNTSLYKE